MKSIDYMDIAKPAMDQIKKGAFLTVKQDKRLNTMTIGWATIGFVWRKPIFMVAVRDSRYTFELIEKAADFTVSVPSADMQSEISFCGTKSGKDVDKFETLKLTTVPGKMSTSPIIKVPGYHFECKIIFKAPMDHALLAAEFKTLYPQKDYHTLYFGEILMAYQI